MTEQTHHYLSTGCLHGEHDYCKSMVGQAGTKRPAQCKFCAAQCECDCRRRDFQQALADLGVSTYRLDPKKHEMEMRIEALEDWIIGKGYDLSEVNAEISD